MFFFPRGNKGLTRMTLGSGDFLLVGYMLLEKRIPRRFGFERLNTFIFET